MILSDDFRDTGAMAKKANRYETELRALAEELEALIALADPTKDSITPDKAIGRLTRMEAMQAQQMSQEGRRRQEKRLAAVRRALERIEEGTYGRCIRCGAEIAEGRLEFMPESALCVKCAARR